MYATEENKHAQETTLVNEKVKGVETITVAGLDGWRKGERVPFMMYRVNPSNPNEIEAGSQTSWTGVVSQSGNTISGLKCTGGNDGLYPVGSVVVATPTGQWANDIKKTFEVAHNEDGTLKDGMVTSKAIAEKSVDTSRLADKAVTSDKVDWATTINAKQPYARQVDVPMGFGTMAQYERYGNLVLVRMIGTIGRNHPNNGMTDVGERIPDGFKPVNDTTLNTQMIQANRTIGQAFWRLRPNGTPRLYTSTSSSAEFWGTVSYITRDPWPDNTIEYL